MAKRCFDLLLAGTGLAVLSPLLLVLALWIKLDSPGPGFCRQERGGRGGALFRIHKLRTMTHTPSSDGPQITVGADRRVTRAGRLLRHYKLDELVQLIDVLKGDMSLVGPRPEVPRYVAMYPPAVRDKVLSVRPGITDLASIEYRDEAGVLAAAADPEAEYVNVVMPAKLRLAMQYVDQASLATDLRLIARTLRTVFRP